MDNAKFQVEKNILLNFFKKKFNSNELAISHIDTIISSNSVINVIDLNTLLEIIEYTSNLKSSTKKIYMFDEDYALINEFDNSNLAGKFLKKSNDYITSCIRNETFACGKYYFSYKSYFEPKILRSINQVKKRIDTPVYLFTLEGEFIKKFDSLKLLKEFLGFKITSHIDKVLKIQNKYYASYEPNFVVPINKKSNRNKPVYLFTLEGEFIKEFDSLKSINEFFDADVYINVHKQWVIKQKYYASYNSKIIIKDNAAKNRPVYLFDYLGEYVTKYDNVNLLSSELNAQASTIRANINKGHFYNNKYYFSWSKELSETIKRKISKLINRGKKIDTNFINEL